MSLRKIFTGKPGNAKELIQYAKQNNKDITCVLVSYHEFDQTGYQLIMGKAIFGCDDERWMVDHKRTRQGFTKNLSMEAGYKTEAMDLKTMREAGDATLHRMHKEIDRILYEFKKANMPVKVKDYNLV